MKKDIGKVADTLISCLKAPISVEQKRYLMEVIAKFSRTLKGAYGQAVYVDAGDFDEMGKDYFGSIEELIKNCDTASRFPLSQALPSLQKSAGFVRQLAIHAFLIGNASTDASVGR